MWSPLLMSRDPTHWIQAIFVRRHTDPRAGPGGLHRGRMRPGSVQTQGWSTTLGLCPVAIGDHGRGWVQMQFESRGQDHGAHVDRHGWPAGSWYGPRHGPDRHPHTAMHSEQYPQFRHRSGFFPPFFFTISPSSTSFKIVPARSGNGASSGIALYRFSFGMTSSGTGL